MPPNRLSSVLLFCTPALFGVQRLPCPGARRKFFVLCQNPRGSTGRPQGRSGRPEFLAWCLSKPSSLCARKDRPFQGMLLMVQVKGLHPGLSRMSFLLDQSSFDWAEAERMPWQKKTCQRHKAAVNNQHTSELECFRTADSSSAKGLRKIHKP